MKKLFQSKFFSNLILKLLKTKSVQINGSFDYMRATLASKKKYFFLNKKYISYNFVYEKCMICICSIEKIFNFKVKKFDVLRL